MQFNLIVSHTLKKIILNEQLLQIPQRTGFSGGFSWHFKHIVSTKDYLRIIPTVDCFRVFALSRILLDNAHACKQIKTISVSLTLCLLCRFMYLQSSSGCQVVFTGTAAAYHSVWFSFLYSSMLGPGDSHQSHSLSCCLARSLPYWVFAEFKFLFLYRCLL